MIFFNHVGDEMGGFIFGDNGGKGHFGQFTFDKVGGDQSIGFRYLESDNGTYETGIQIWQQPSFQGRLFVGKQRDNSAVLLMSDVEGRPRIRMQVAPDGTPKLEFLDAAGRVVSSLPGAPGASKP